MKIYKISSDINRLQGELKRIGVDDYALNMCSKGVGINLCLCDLSPAAGNILKQEAIASGMDAALKRGSVSCSVETTDALLMGQVNSYSRLVKRLKIQPFGLSKVAGEIEDYLKNMDKVKSLTVTGGKKLVFDTPKVMGILNLTPDSFSDGGMFADNKQAASQIDAMIDEGVDIIDIGGMSSRPMADYIGADEEIRRIDYALKYACEKENLLISVDTCYPKTAEFALKHNAHIINDITGLRDKEMRKICAEYGAGVCIMHMMGDPKNMQKNIDYKNLVYEIKNFFYDRINESVKDGLSTDNIIIDPGFGFGKTLDNNYFLLKHLSEFESFGLPLLAGISRKSMIGGVTGKDAMQRLCGTVALNTAALMAGAAILRVHDVAAGVETVQVINHLMKAKE